MRNILKYIRKFWNRLNKPSLYDIWSRAFDKLQTEKKANGESSEYWRTWYEEVCPAYRNLTEATPKFLRHSLTNNILGDMDKPVNQRKHFQKGDKY